MPRRRRACNVARRVEKANSMILKLLPHVFEYVDTPTLLLGVRLVSQGWASRVAPFHTLALRTGIATDMGILRTQAARMNAFDSLLRVFCSPLRCGELRVVDVTTLSDQWGDHAPWVAGRRDMRTPNIKICSDNCLWPLLSCQHLETLAVSIGDGGTVLPELLRMPQLHFARLQGMDYGDIGGDSKLPDEVCEAITASKLRTLHLRYACWTGRQLALPSTLRELVIESYPWDDNWGCCDENETWDENSKNIPGEVVVGSAQLQLLALSMSCILNPEEAPSHPMRIPSPIHEKPHFYDRFGCWDGALLRSFGKCGFLQTVVLPQDALCITDDGANAFGLALITASQQEAFCSWRLLGLQLQQVRPHLQLQHVSPADLACLSCAQLPQPLMRRVLDFAITGPTVERPAVWPKMPITADGQPDYDQLIPKGFPTLAEHCGVASDFHVHNAFHVGEEDKVKDLLFEQEWHRQSKLPVAQRTIPQLQHLSQRRRSSQRKKRNGNAKVATVASPVNALDPKHPPGTHRRHNPSQSQADALDGACFKENHHKRKKSCAAQPPIRSSRVLWPVTIGLIAFMSALIVLSNYTG